MGDKGATGPDVAEQARLLAAVRTVRGVAGAELTPGGPGGLGTLRVQLAPGADDVVVAVEVNELLRRQFALAVDADRLEVVEETTVGPAAGSSGAPGPQGRNAGAGAGEGSESPRPQGRHSPPPTRSGGGPAQPVSGPVQPGGEPSRPLGGRSPAGPGGAGSHSCARLALNRATFSSAGLGAQVTVTVSDAQGPYTGTIDVGAAPGAVGRAAAAATLAAVQAAFASREGVDPDQATASGRWPARLEVDRVEVVGHEPDAVATVVISVLTRSGIRRQAGAALVAGDARHAIVRATLAAVNRHLELTDDGSDELD